VSQKSFISSQQELMVTFLLQKVCLGVICENKKFEGTLRTEKVREVFGGVGEQDSTTKTKEQGVVV
jgi:hypothetical protein